MKNFISELRQVESNVDAFYSRVLRSPNGGTIAKIGAAIGLSSAVVTGAFGIISMVRPEAIANPDLAEPLPAAERSVDSLSVDLAPNGSPLETHNTSTIPYEEQPAASQALGINEVPGSIETRNVLLLSALGGLTSTVGIVAAPYFGRREQA